ncbi:aldehyde dehydrogenase [Pseudofrankia asymbiotica]|uniref:aldehyde dehydrogenase n=1 Tax=Pseudofrankia asymbiotica TaxID=1834516 RepID=UPI001F51674E|nr:aldehyde dehydrogenase [Pseudofrankia asymbiotica]
MTTATNYIDGQFVPSSVDARIPVINPTTEQVIGSVADSSADDIDMAARAADRALPAWAALTPKERAGYIRALANALLKRSDVISRLVSEQNGTPIGFATFGNQIHVDSVYRYSADLADRFEVETEVEAPDGTTTIVRREPIGVAGLIVPWNGPTALLAWKLGPALAAGCTVVIKPSPETSLDLIHLAEASVEAGFPPGVINYVTGAVTAGEALVRHPLIRKIAFTGSTVVGKSIARTAGSLLKPVTLELGGKSAGILLDDVEVETFTRNLSTFVIPITGQTCYSNTRILAPRSRYDEMVEALSSAMDEMTIGDPFDPETQAGPLTSKSQLERVTGYIQAGIAEGAQVTAGGGRPTRFDRGYFVEGTVFANVKNDMRIAREEIFGPVIAVIPYEGDDEAVRLANDSPFGLGGSVFTSDPDRGLEIARKVQTGTFGVNRYNVAINAPFGGYKESGIGRELGADALHAYSQTKAIYI